MIPKIIHYCWFSGSESPERTAHASETLVGAPELVQRCIRSWHVHMPETEGWSYCHWNEQSVAAAMGMGSFEDVLNVWPQYVCEAYEAKKYAFVSDYVRLWALEREGGLYLDTDVEMLRSMESLLGNIAFIGFEESLAHLPGTCVFGCEAHCQWVKDMLALYNRATFLRQDGSQDTTTNVQRMGRAMVERGLIPNGKEQYIADWGLRVYDHHHFSPITSTRVMRKSKDTYCIHHFAGSWTEKNSSIFRSNVFFYEITNALIQIKRFIIGRK